jgi:hypothetical protein
MNFCSTSTVLTALQASPIQNNFSDGFTMTKRMARIKGNTNRLS